MAKVKTKAQRTEIAKKAVASYRKRLKEQTKTALAAGKPAPLSAAQKAQQTLRARKNIKEEIRKNAEAAFKQTENLGRSIRDAHETVAEVASPASVHVTPDQLLPGTSETAVRTAFRDAFEKAGINTAKLELQQQVKALLDKNRNDPERMLGAFWTLVLRRSDLRHVLLLDYALRIAGTGQDGADAHEPNADSSAPGQTTNDAQSRSAGGKFKHVVRNVPRSPVGKKVMAESLGIWSRKIGDKALNELTYEDLPALKRDAIREAGKLVLDGMYCAADALFIGKIENYAVVDDKRTKIRDVIPTDVLQRFNREAAKEAPPVVDVGRIAYETTLIKQIEHRP